VRRGRARPMERRERVRVRVERSWPCTCLSSTHGVCACGCALSLAGLAGEAAEGCAGARARKKRRKKRKKSVRAKRASHTCKMGDAAEDRASEALARQLQAEEDEALARALAASALEARPPAAGTDWAARLRSGVGVVARHAAPATRAALIASLPLDRLRAEAARAVAADAAFRALDGDDDDTHHPLPPLHPTLALLTRLCAWFKGESVFSWVDAPGCAGCGGATRPAGVATTGLTPAETAGLASRVELYACAGACATGDGRRITRFPRLNCPLALWHPAHRRGRCGEWANAFGAALAAAGLDARHVVDTTGDHVWCEVWVSGSGDEGGGEGGGGGGSGRWVHADPCEGALDAPRLYERGWGKKPALVVAYGRGGVADVTHRYTAVRGADLAARRAEAGVPGAPALAAILAALSAEAVRAAGGGGPVDAARAAADAAALLAGEGGGGGSVPAASLPGRTSGAAAWVAERGEEGGGGGENGEAGAAQPTRYTPVVGAAAAPGRPGPPGAVRLADHPAAAPAAAPPSLAGLHARASGPHPPGEGPAAGLDGSPASKWLCHGAPSPTRPAWLEVRLGPRGGNEGTALPPTVVPVAYGLTAGNDAPGRDPVAWEVQGRRSGGGGQAQWVTLDARQCSGAFAGRGDDSDLFTIPVERRAPVDALRLVVSGAAGGAGADAVQLSRWEVWVEAPLEKPPPPPPLSKDAFAAAVRAAFEARVKGGMAPNDAAVAALDDVTGGRRGE
jgi:peptide-N4-(N-acetyl-beta-glucosaminyl)asparagine amidase